MRIDATHYPCGANTRGRLVEHRGWVQGDTARLFPDASKAKQLMFFYLVYLVHNVSVLCLVTH